MSAISGFLAAMAPFMAMSVPIYAVVRLLMLIRRKQTVNWHHEAGLFLFVIFAAGLASQTVIPQIVCGSDGISVSMSGRSHETWLIPFRFICYTYEDMVVRHSFYSLLINILGNIVMFMPFGFFFPLLWRISGKKALRKNQENRCICMAVVAENRHSCGVEFDFDIRNFTGNGCDFVRVAFFG